MLYRSRSHETLWVLRDGEVPHLPVPDRVSGEATHWRPTHVRVSLHDNPRPHSDTSTGPYMRMSVCVQGDPTTAKGEALPQNVALIIRWFGSFSDCGVLRPSFRDGSGVEDLPEPLVSMIKAEFPEFWASA